MCMCFAREVFLPEGDTPVVVRLKLLELVALIMMDSCGTVW